MPSNFASRVALAVTAILGAGFASPPPPSHTRQYHGVNPEYLDLSVSPTVDFYRFSNGAWLDGNAIPRSGTKISASLQAQIRNEELVWSVIQPSINDLRSSKGSPEQIIGQFMRSGLNEHLADQMRSDPIRPELARIDRIETRGDVVAELARLHRWLIPAGFKASVDYDFKESSHKILALSQGGLTLRNRELYRDHTPTSSRVQAQLLRSIQKTFELIGEDADSSKHQSERILAIETRLAEAALPEAETGSVDHNFHRLTLAQLAVLAPGLDWTRYFQQLGAPDIEFVDVGQTDSLKSFSSLLQWVKIKDWQSYLRWQFLVAVSPFLSADFARQHFELIASINGQQQMPSRAEVVMNEADLSLGNVLGELYSRHNGIDSSRKGVETIVQNIRGSLRGLITQLNWMSPSTKEKALEKLDRMRVQIGYPERWPDSSKLSLRDDSFVLNVLRARSFEFQRQLDNMSRPIDINDWDIRTYASDARYNPSLNAIFLPAGLLHQPVYDPNADDASNYGTLGMVVGHEFMHAFDSRGCKFNSRGQLSTWWSAKDAALYEEHQRSLVLQYNGYGMGDAFKVNGTLTLEENLADLGGITVAYAAFKQASKPRAGPQDGFTPEQRFFIAFGQLFRSKARPEHEHEALMLDPHSPPRYRVTGVLQNVPEFWQAFHAIPPKPLIKVW